MAMPGGFPRRPVLGRTPTINDTPEDPALDVMDRSSDEDDEEVEIKISASGSVLTPSSDPYDKFQKLKQANAILMACRLPSRPPGKVRFNDTVLTAEETEEGSEHITGIETLKTSPGKLLLVTVPTGFSEDVNSDDEVVDETDLKPDEPIKIIEDCTDVGSKSKKSLAHNDYSVDMKSVDDDYENTVEDLTTTLVSLCRMTSECEDTNLENNISKYEKIEVDPGNDLEIIQENEERNDDQEEVETKEESNEEDGSEESLSENENDPTAEQITPENIVQRIASARMALKDSKKDDEKTVNDGRPATSPGKRVCFKNQWAYAKLPSYNGLRSEYGLSAEQLHERKKKRVEAAKLQRQRKEEIYKEEKRRQKENEQMFATWLVKKKKEAAMKAARRKQLQSAFHFKTLPAPTSHLEKMGLLRKKVLARREHTCYSLEEFFKNAKPHEQKTYKIYLGLCVE
ncbi:hypothetical protein GE061_016189 [Apolygus lucorum]|uniref:Uncharacterized protein n=1 Tax=Apolygus lucorum TaxID=248454 RepID=A0A6A4K0W7_APOLU|nr:hypothetical protein GE061_016189 [Apolygus lucorum]